MSQNAGTSGPGGAERHHKPKPFAPIDFEPFAGGADPARVSEAAHLAAQALVRHGRDSDDPVITKRLVKLADEQGLEAIAEMWAESPARSLPGALWRLRAASRGGAETLNCNDRSCRGSNPAAILPCL